LIHWTPGPLPCLILVSAFLTTGCLDSSPSLGPSSNAVVIPRSIGGLSLGERRGDVEATLGKGDVRNLTTKSTTVAYPDWGLTVVYAVGPQPADESVIVVRTTSKRFQTARGVGVGSSLAEVRREPGVRCFGVRTCQIGFQNSSSPGAVFVLDNGVVVIISIQAFA
jgi:hypothetical protein